MSTPRCIIASIVWVLVCAGCDNVVDPIASDRNGSVAIYGVLDMRTERQLLRLEALRSTIEEAPGGLDGIAVRSVDEGTGVTQDWALLDSTDRSGTPITLFEAFFNPRESATYRVEVYRSDSVLSYARTTIPTRPVLTTGSVVGDSSQLAQSIHLSDINGIPERAQVAYTVIDSSQSLPVTIPVAYGRLATQPVSDLTFDVVYGSDRFVVMAQLGREMDDEGVRFHGLSLTFDLPSPEWTNVQVDNVAGGLGFFGAVGRYSYTWTLEDEVVAAIGWINEQSAQ